MLDWSAGWHMNDIGEEGPEMNDEGKNGGAEALEAKKARVLAELEVKRAAIARQKRAVLERRRIGRIIGIVVAVVLALVISIYGIRNALRKAGPTAGEGGEPPQGQAAPE